MHTITPIPAFNDNYIWLITNSKQEHGQQYAVIVDPGDATPVLDTLQKKNIIPLALFITHHHWDHSGGIQTLKSHYDALQVYGSRQEATEGVTHLLKDGDEIDIPQMGLKFETIDIPGHTHGHIAYYGHGLLFCGDTLFASGCGRLFEGTAAQMSQSLNRLANLPENTQVYCGHEYTLAVEPNNPAIIDRIKIASALRDQGLPTLPSTIGLERQSNPFLRCREPDVIEAAEKKAAHSLSSPVDVFQTLRAWKDVFTS
jgi:hydroxyacylglutathione hydrolase